MSLRAAISQCTGCFPVHHDMLGVRPQSSSTLQQVISKTHVRDSSATGMLCVLEPKDQPSNVLVMLCNNVFSSAKQK